MKILVICQYYYPEPFRIQDICEEMVRRGHEVHVVTGYPNYPEGNIYVGYGKGKKTEETLNGVKVHRCFTIPRKTGIVFRFLNYYSYAITSSNYVKSKKCMALDGREFDIVFCNQLSPVMMATAAVAYKKKRKIPVLMYCLDLWPESLIAGGIEKNSLIYKIFHRVSKKIYCKMDKILITSRMFSAYLTKEFGVQEESIKYLPQYAESIFVEKEYGVKSNIFNFMFAGNIGSIQSVETILQAAVILQKESVCVHIVGSGSDLERLQKIKEENNIDNVIFYGRKPLEEMPSFYEKADAMLVTMKEDPVLNLTLPGKVQSYMAVGKPIIGAINGETKSIIESAKCGFCGEAENAEELASNIRKFILSDNKREMARNSRKFYEENFTENMFMDCLEKEMKLLKE